MLRAVRGWDWIPQGLSGSENARLLAADRFYSSASNGYFGNFNSVGRFGFGGCLNWALAPGNLDANQIVGLTGSSRATNTMGCAVFVDQANNAYDWVTFFDAVTGAPQLSFYFAEYGVIKVYRGYPYSGTLLVASQPGSFQEDEWFYFEAKATIDATAGAVECRVNTATVISLVAANTMATLNAFADSYGFGVARGPTFGNAAFVKFDDFYFNDDTGSYNNGFLGNCRVMTQKVAGNSTPQDFTIGGSSPAATAWQSLLNANLDDTKYLFDNTAGHKSLFTIEAIINAPMVFGIQISGAYRQDDATQRTARNVIKSGSTTAEGGDQLTNQTYTMYKDIWEINPATSVGFTGAELNALLIGPKEQA